MKYFYDRFEEYTWQYIADTHSDSVKAEILMDIPPAKEFRIHITRFRPGAGADPIPMNGNTPCISCREQGKW
jgi:hypothetical protein